VPCSVLSPSTAIRIGSLLQGDFFSSYFSIYSRLLGLTIDIRGYRSRARTRLRERTFGIADRVAIPLMAAGGVLFTYAFFTFPLS
ncbi:MAG: hypothetical protein LUQ12_05070, partial [Methanoregulaceae archaeon]|nr:hypothetical protein [Methanoregulaceae archaeon]